MVSLKSVLIILLITVIATGDLYLLEVGLTNSYSPKVENFYHSVGKELRFFYYSATNDYNINYSNIESDRANNLRSTSELYVNFARRQIVLNTWRFTPLTSLTFSHKKIEFLKKKEITFLFFHSGSKTVQKLTALNAGFSPEFSRIGKSISSTGTTPYLAIRPLGRVSQRFYRGHLDDITFTTGQIGGEVQFGFSKSHVSTQKGGGLTLTIRALYERAILGDRHIKTVYGYIFEREISYPKESLHIGAGLSFTIRKFK